MRLVAPGGRARETQNASAAVAIGTRTLSEAGSVGSWSREQVRNILGVSSLFGAGRLCFGTNSFGVCSGLFSVVRPSGRVAAVSFRHPDQRHARKPASTLLCDAIIFKALTSQAWTSYLSMFISQSKTLRNLLCVGGAFLRWQPDQLHPGDGRGVHLPRLPLCDAR